MLQLKWSDGLETADDIDPGKDIFALLFLSFFLINALLLFCISGTGESATRVNTAAKGGDLQVEEGVPAFIAIQGDAVLITQNNRTYRLPQEAARFKNEARLVSRPDADGNDGTFIVVMDPGRSMSAGEILKAVRLLNDLEIGMDFRTAENP